MVAAGTAGDFRMELPYLQSDNSVLNQLQTKWRSVLNPVIANELTNGFPIENVSLANGVTVINHLLGRKMMGWFITDINGAATVYRSKALNDKTLTLTSNASVVVNLWVF